MKVTNYATTLGTKLNKIFKPNRAEVQFSLGRSYCETIHRYKQLLSELITLRFLHNTSICNRSLRVFCRVTMVRRKLKYIPTTHRYNAKRLFLRVMSNHVPNNVSSVGEILQNMCPPFWFVSHILNFFNHS